MIRAEAIALSSVRAPWIAGAAAVAGGATTAWAVGWLVPQLGSLDPELAASVGDLAPTSAAERLASMSPLAGADGGSLGVVLVAVLLMGALVATAGERSGGMVQAALAAPRRGRIVFAKAAVAGIAAGGVAILATIAQAVVVAVTPATLAAGGIGAEAAEIASVLGRSAVALGLLGVVGLAVAVLVRGQTAAVLVLLGALVADLIAQGLLAIAPQSAGLAAATPLALATAASSPAELATTPPAIALAALATLAAGLVAIAAVTLRRRDL